MNTNLTQTPCAYALKVHNGMGNDSNVYNKTYQTTDMDGLPIVEHLAGACLWMLLVLSSSCEE